MVESGASLHDPPPPVPAAAVRRERGRVGEEEGQQ